MDTFTKAIGWVVAVAWFTSVVWDIINGPYSTPLELHGLMGAVVGALYTQGQITKGRR